MTFQVDLALKNFFSKKIFIPQLVGVDFHPSIKDGIVAKIALYGFVEDAVKVFQNNDV